MIRFVTVDNLSQGNKRISEANFNVREEIIFETVFI